MTSIGDQAFEDCRGLTSVTIPNSVTFIGDVAFRGCRGLTSVSIGNSVISIGNEAFSSCSGLTSVTIPNSVTSIGNSAFRGCSSLTSVTIPNSVTSIGGWAFYGCSSLTSPIYNSDCFAFLPSSYSGEYNIPEGIKTICGSAFYGCSGLTSITIPNSVTFIGDDAFRGCSGLTSITIPNSVTSIGSDAFSGTDSLWIVKSYIAEPFSISKYSEDTYRKGTLFVPKGTKDLYIRFDGWREFLNIEEMGDEPAPNGQCATPTIIVAGKKISFQCETPDAEFTSYLTSEEYFEGAEVELDNVVTTFTLTVYATAPGYDRSKPAQYVFSTKKGDVNGDGVVDVSDYIGVANLILFGTIDGK